MPFIQTIVLTLLLVFFSVWMHYEFLYRWPQIEKFIAKKHRGRILRLVLFLIVLHCIEILLFGFGFWCLDQIEGAGHLSGQNGFTPSDYIYFAAAAYTTVGFGDLYPIGGLRLLTGLVSLVGLILITWSASYTFLEMQRYWNRE